MVRALVMWSVRLGAVAYVLGTIFAWTMALGVIAMLVWCVA
jgi:hypothetical protein